MIDMRVLIPPDATILFINVAAEVEMGLVAEDDFLRKTLCTLGHPKSEVTTLVMVRFLQFLHHLDLVFMTMKIQSQNPVK